MFGKVSQYSERKSVIKKHKPLMVKFRKIVNTLVNCTTTIEALS